MKAFGLISLLLTMALVAYLMVGSKDSPGSAQTAMVVEDRARTAADVATVASVRGSIAAFKASHERFPNTLEEMVDSGELSRVPGGLDYNAATGEVSAKP
jgi:hypothetical protein